MTVTSFAAVGVVTLIALVVLLGTGLVKPFLGTPALGGNESTRTTQLIQAVTREDQVVLLSLGIQGIEEKSANSTFFGVDVPGSERTAFMRYEFAAKLGFDGGDVEVERTAENAFTVSIPEFIFIGHEFISSDGEPFKMVVESSGALSWVTPEINEADMINRILSEGARADYIDANRETLEQQTVAFYSGIIRGLGSDAVLTFEFR